VTRHDLIFHTAECLVYAQTKSWPSWPSHVERNSYKRVFFFLSGDVRDVTQCYMLLSHQQVVITTCSPICIEIDPQIFWQKQHLLLHVLHRVHVENGGRWSPFFFCPVLVCVEALDGVSLVHLHRGIHAVSPPPFFKLSFVGPKSKANKIHSHYSPIVFEKEQKAIIWECIEPRYIHGLEGNRRTFWGTEPREPV
jgi:hypothetical protein